MTTRSTEGVLLVDKPAGRTSHDVVVAARRELGERRIGHAGTLDPFATGLLVLLVGRCTRLLPYIDGEPKEYLATIRFGTATDTDDHTGSVIGAAPPPPDDAIDRAIAELSGAIHQVPPTYSAKRVRGRRAYAAARRGDPLILPPVPVTVHEWRILSRHDDELHVLISCSGGTYVRALARDLGRLAGSAAHLAALRRTRSGRFTVKEAIALEDGPRLRGALRPAAEAVPSLPFERLDEDRLGRVVQGQQVPARVAGERAALLDSSGRLVAIGERRGSAWQPRAVLVDA